MINNNGNIKSSLLLLLIIIFFVPLLWIFIVRFEKEKPVIEFHGTVKYLNASQKFEFTISDIKSGLQKIKIALNKDGKQIILYKKEFSASGLTRTGDVNKKKIILNNIRPEKFGTGDGKALLHISVTDYSWRNWLHGNTIQLEKEIIIDTKPPRINLLSKTHNITQGGTGLAVYQLSELCSKSGVYVDDDFYPGYSGYFKDPNILLSFFALDYKKGSKSKIFVYAADQAGNSLNAGIYYHIKNKKFKKDIINISDNFLNYKVPELEPKILFLPGSNNSMLDKFLLINKELRKANFKKITEVVNKTDNVLLWEGKFLRLPRSASKAGFADARIYKYHGKTIDHQTHLGVDLASVAHAPVPAANGGKVIFTDSLGIYGKTVLIDHGFGLFSMYSHLSSIDVNNGQIISKGKKIGRTGKTGLAGGDHLHFGMLVNKTFVNPIEWWDAKWIKNNIILKLNLADKAL